VRSGFSPNEVRYYSRYTCIGIANIFFGGTLLQAFLSARGVGSEQIGMISATFSVVQMLTMLLFSAAVDKLRDPLKKSALFIGFLPLYFLALLPITLISDMPAQTIFSVVMTAGVVQSVFLGLHGILDYRIPYQIIDMRDYARFNSYAGIISGVMTVAVSSLTTFALARFAMDRVMSVMYALSALCMAAASLFTRRMKSVEMPAQTASKQDSGLLATIKLPAFRVLFLPNLMRGFNTGVLGMLATVAIHELGISAAQTSSMSVISTAAAIFGAYGFMRLARRFRVHWLYFGASIAMCCALPLLLPAGDYAVFAAVYACLVLGQAVADNAAPVLVAKLVPYECIGSFTSIRIGVYTGGISLGSMSAGFVLGRMPVMWLLLFSGLMQLGSGLVYYLFARANADLLDS